MSEPQADVTELLREVSSGGKSAWNHLLAVVYRELHVMAQGAMRKARPGQTLQTTALVHEAYLRLVKHKEDRWNNRAHFFSVAAKAMRQILVDKYRLWKAAKRGAGHGAVPLDELKGLLQEKAGVHSFQDLEALDRALSKLEALPGSTRKCTVVELRYFVGLSYKETAEVLGVSVATVIRDWEFTRAWLFEELSGADLDES
ncbi:MAG: sigma-70 family RNA polymerase sigma factor [Planctomycetes bacterium]|nr:sigma-70 family RNA polymerase sigma factor [Planctomycetota bacterium]